MPTFETPGPITATIEVIGGDVRISAGDRTTTTVSIEPSDPSSDEDRRVAEQTRVELDGDNLVVKAPRLRSWLPRSTGGAIDVAIELPAGSNVHGDASMADFHTDGRLGECRLKTSLGRIAVDSADRLKLRTGIGDIGVDRAAGHVEISTGSGEVRVRELASTAVIKNSNGDTWVGVAHADARLTAANGDIAVDRAEATVAAKSANGDVRLGDAVRGSVVLETRIGDVEVGIPDGTAAWLDVRAGTGRVHNALEASEAPEPSADSVEVRARTTVGDVLIRRS